MSSLDLFLKQLVEAVITEEQLDEKAITYNDAKNDDLALYVKRSDHSFFLVLYRSKNTKDINNPNTFKEAIVGYIEIKFNVGCESWVVKYSAAVQGFGPLMYELAMSLVSPDFIRADTSYVSPEARNVWNYFFNHRANEFNIKKIDENSLCLPFGRKYLKYGEAIYHSYSLLNPIPVHNLEESHEKNLSSLNPEEQKLFEFYLRKAAENLFNKLFK